MLKSVSINGYRQLKDFNIDGLSRFNLFVGPNNSAKSSFLEAIFMHCAPLNFNILLSILSIRLGGFSPEPSIIFDNLKSLLSISDSNQKISKIIVKSKWDTNERKTTLAFIENTIDSSLSQKLAGSHGSSNVTYIQHNRESEGGFLAGSIVLGFGTNFQKDKEVTIDFVAGQPLRVIPPEIKTDISASFSDPFMHRRPDSGIEEYSNAVKKGRQGKIIKILNTLDKCINDIVILVSDDKRPELFVSYGSHGLMPLSNLGDGMRRIILIASQIVNCENGVFLIDELESSIHERALRTFISWLIEICEENNIQMFATTHSLECVDAVLDSDRIKLNDLSLFRMSRHNTLIQSQKVAGNDLKEIRYELGQDVRG